jgi:hypothetical protein
LGEPIFVKGCVVVQLTTEMMQRFVGGQMEVQNSHEEYLYRGEIETIRIEDDTVVVRLVWMARGEGFPTLPTGWVVEHNHNYRAGLVLFGIEELPPGSGGGGTRICMHSAITNELVVFFPPDGSKLDPRKVKGLTLATEV